MASLISRMRDRLARRQALSAEQARDTLKALTAEVAGALDFVHRRDVANSKGDDTHDYVYTYLVAPTKEQLKKGDVVALGMLRAWGHTGFTHAGLTNFYIEASDGRGGWREVYSSVTLPDEEQIARLIKKAKPDWWRRCKPTMSVRGKKKTVVFF